MLNISEFSVQKLRGKANYKLKIRDNCLILVGENGTGKSTIINMLFFYLTRQWKRLLEFNFTNIEVKIGGNFLSISREDIAQSFQSKKSYSSVFSEDKVRQYVRNYINRRSLDTEDVSLSKELLVEKISRNFNIPISYAKEIIESEHYVSARERNKLKESLANSEKLIRDTFSCQFLFLPTYRRIEQELKFIFPEIADDILHSRTIEPSYRRRRSSKKSESASSFIEFVEFGMEDVRRLIVRKLETIREQRNSGVLTLTSNFFFDIINDEYSKFDFNKITNLDSFTTEQIFSRLDTAILSEENKGRLRNFIEVLKDTDRFSDRDKIFGYFIYKLSKLNEEQIKAEKSIQSFTETCNKYLYNKYLSYDSANFNITVKDDYSFEDDPIQLQYLSSGEKQIVSLFSHIFLSNQNDFFVFIDEPELSLSVSWQRQFLPDIRSSGHCSGLIAVTHSPFIFDNKLDKYAHDISEFFGD